MPNKKKETKVPPKKRTYKKRLQSTTPDPADIATPSLDAPGVASLLQALHKHGYIHISEIQNLLKK